MSLRCSAVYEQGVFRPLTRPELSEGEQVEIIVVPGRTQSDRRPADILAEIAALPVEGSGDPPTSEDHDRVLYGWEKTP